MIKLGKNLDLNWEDIIIVKASEVSANNQFLSDMKVGQIYLKQVYNGFDLFKMVVIRPRRLEPLSDRRGQIVHLIKKERSSVRRTGQDIDVLGKLQPITIKTSGNKDNNLLIFLSASQKYPNEMNC
jgi:hypothetical protein